jgi:hypothetical protein
MRILLVSVLLVVLAGPPVVAAEPVLLFDVTMTNGQPYVSLMSVANAFRAGLRISTRERAVNLEYEGREASLGEGTILTLGRQLVVLSASPYWSGNELYVPLDAVQKIFYVHVRWRLQTRQVVFSPVRPSEAGNSVQP